MIKTILIIIVSVSIFGLIVFVLVKNAMKKKIDDLIEEENKKSNNFD
jgi:low affinity Fe/Cu permease|tara:strand:- start:2261 stop:2401 length:141 start_codon:yes stop_codon:yes gene_type:complete